MSDYKIISIDFSLEPKLEGEVHEGMPNDTGVASKRITQLIANVSFEFIGLTSNPEIGTCTVIVDELCSTEVDKDGFVISFSKADIPDKDAVMSKVEPVIEKAIKSSAYMETERNFKESALAKLNKECTVSRFIQRPSYEELEDWNTGIGAKDINILPID